MIGLRRVGQPILGDEASKRAGHGRRPGVGADDGGRDRARQHGARTQKQQLSPQLVILGLSTAEFRASTQPGDASFVRAGVGRGMAAAETGAKAGFLS